MRIFTLIVPVFLFFSTVKITAQDISYGKSVFDLTGETGTVVTPDVEFSNSGVDTIEIFVNRIYKNLPANWTSCYCFITCYTPEVDTLRFKLAPGQNAIIGIGFNTDTIPGIGYVKITVEQLGGTQKDTLSFSGSTMMSGIAESLSYSSVKMFPNPASDKLIIHSSVQEKYDVLITAENGAVLARSNGNFGRTELSFKESPAGIYLVTLKYQSGKTETKRILKN